MSSLSFYPIHKIEKELAALMMEIVPRTMREIRTSTRASGCGHMPLPQFRVLANVWRSPKTNKELAEDIGLSVPATSRIIASLEQKDLIKRLVDKEDRRVTHIYITNEGSELFKKMRRHTCDEIADRMRALSLREKKELQKGLNLMSKTMLGISLKES